MTLFSLPIVLAALAAPVPQPVDVEIRHFAYSPAGVSIVAGTTIRWTNHDAIEHTVTSQTGSGTLVPSGLFDSGLLNLGESFEFSFTTPGTFYYFCVPHGSSMQAIVTVLPCSADFDADGTRAVPDIFAFLGAWFAEDPQAEFDGQPGIGVPDIFAFLALWFAGCG